MSKTKGRRWGIAALCFLTGFGTMPVYAAAADEFYYETVPVTNADFEQPAQIPGWTIGGSGAATLSNDQKSAGDRSLLIAADNQQIEASTVAGDVYGGGTYVLNAKLRWDNAAAGNLNYRLSYYDSGDQPLGDSEIWSAPKTIGSWLDLTGESTAPAGAAKARITFASDAGSSLAAYLDEVVLTNKNDAADVLSVTNGGFESFMQIPGWSTGAPRMTAIVAPYEGSKRLLLHDYITGDNSNADSKIQIRSDKISVEAGSEYRVSLSLKSVSQSNSIELALTYFKENGEQAKFKNVLLSKAAHEGKGWMTVELAEVAPIDAATVQISFGSGAVSLTKAYIDNITLGKKVMGTPPTEPEPEPEVPDALLVNPGFERALVDGKIPGWSLDKTTVGLLEQSSAKFRGGSKSLLFHDSSATTRLRVMSDKFAVAPLHNVNASVYTFVEQQTHSIVLEIYFYNDGGTAVGSVKQELYNAAKITPNVWNELLVSAQAPAGATQASIAFYSGDPSLTKAYFDDASVEVVPVVPDPVETVGTELINPGFELAPVNGQIPGWSLGAGTEGTLSLNTEIVRPGGTRSLYFKDSSATKGLRVMSNNVAVTPGESIVAKSHVYVKQQTHNIVLQVYFYNEKGEQAGVKQELFGTLALGENEWAEMRLFTDVPTGAKSMRVALYSGEPSLTEAYFDDISFFVVPPETPLNRQYEAPVDLGPMVNVKLGQSGAIQQNANGENEAYFVTNGLPGKFTVLDAETGKLKFSQDIPNTEATWAMTIGPDKNVYFAGTGDGRLYRYLPVEKKVEMLGANPSDNWVWDIEATPDGKIYGGTYSPDKKNGKLFEYDIATGEFRNYGGVANGQDYVRGIAVDDRYIYAGLGTTIQLVKVDRVTGEKTDIPIPGYTGKTDTIADVFIVGDKLLVSVSTINMVVMDLNNPSEVLHTFQYSNMISEADPANPDVIYYKFGTKFYKYDMAANVSSEIELPLPLPDTVRVKDMHWMTMSSGPKSGKTVLAIITQYGEFMLYDPTDNWLSFVDLEIAPQPVRIQALERGFDGRLYFGGYQRGMSVYNPFTGAVDLNISSFAQPEGIGFMNGKVYYGTYVGAAMYSYDPTKPAVLNENPEWQYSVSHQDRPFAITSGDNKLFVGTVPDYGYLGGALAVYDEATDQWTQYDHEQVVQNQSIIGLAYKDGLLYGGTTVWGGLGSTPTEPQAKIFIWDPVAGEKIDEFTPVIPGIDEAPRMIGELSIGPDGLLWGAVDGTIFALDVDTKQVVKSKLVRPSLYNTSKWMPYSLKWAPDGMLYTTLSRKLTVIDPETLAYKVIDDTFVNSMTLGIDGSIYYAPEAGTNLARIAVPETDATLSALTVGGKLLDGFSPGVLEYNHPDAPWAAVQAKAKQTGATVVVEELRGTESKTIIHVTGRDGKSKLAYTINWTLPGMPYPDDPEDPADSVKPVEPVEQAGRQTVKKEELVSNDHGVIEIQIAEGNEIVRLPAQAGEIAGEHPIVLTGGGFAVELAGGALEQLAKQVDADKLQDAVIELGFGEVTDAAKSRLLGSAGRQHHADIRGVSGLYDFSLAIVTKDGERIEAGALDQTFTLSLKLDSDVRPELTAIYRIAEDGTLVYIGGVAEDGRLVAQVDGFGKYAVLEFDKSFDDVVPGHWAESVIQRMAARLIAEGVSETEFAPEGDITRAEFAALVVRALGLQAENGADSEGFADVEDGSWYAGAVAAATQAGLVNGRSDSTFAPDQTITREEMVAVMIRAYAMRTGASGLPSDAAHAEFADQGSISEWAQAAVDQAVVLGLVQGRGDNQFAPKGQLTRAEAIQVLFNLLNK